MKKLLVVVAGLSLSLPMGRVDAADLAQRHLVPHEVWNWTGFYLGAHLGAGLGQTDIHDPAGAAVYGNDIRTPAVRAGLQGGYNWQTTGSLLVLGIEAELSALGADGSNTCFAANGLDVSANCRVRQNALGTVTGRIGYAAGAGGRTLLYAKGGAAWLNESISVTNLLTDPTFMRADRFGWTVGAGIEQAIAPAWSMKFEYDYAGFGSVDVPTPASIVYRPTGYVPVPVGSSPAGQTVQSIKLGLNMKLGADPAARWGGIAASPLGLPVKAATLPLGTEIELGGRVWYSFGRFQKDLGGTTTPALQNRLNSRLTYDSASASGELFGRIDTASDVFIKGFIGGGGIAHGSMRDEDWVPRDGIPYSNTVSDPVTGSIGYATADVGYDVLRDRWGKFGAFVGYHYMRDDKVANGCMQTASPVGYCTTTIPNSTVVITEKDTWNAMRIGVNGVVSLTDRWQLTADMAYLPFIAFRGEDNHVIRREPITVSPESGTGQGVQLEAVLAYKITPSFSVGAGGRYWAMWATGGDAQTNAFGKPCPCQTLPVRSERYGGFLQASYAFDSFQ